LPPADFCRASERLRRRLPLDGPLVPPSHRFSRRCDDDRQCVSGQVTKQAEAKKNYSGEGGIRNRVEAFQDAPTDAAFAEIPDECASTGASSSQGVAGDCRIVVRAAETGENRRLAEVGPLLDRACALWATSSDVASLRDALGEVFGLLEDA
jgi:hypothetical protein